MDSKTPSKFDVQAAAKWAAAEFERYTILAAFDKLAIDRLEPAYRISTSDVKRKFPEFNCVDDLEAFQLAFHHELRKHGLVRVLKGKIKSKEWFEWRKQELERSSKL